MMNTLRRIDRKTSDEDAWNILENSEYGFLCTINPDGTPHCVPMCHVVMDGCVYFHCARAGQKLDNLRRDARASFSCVLSSEILRAEYSVKYASCMAEGMLEEVSNEGERQKAMRRLNEKYCPDHLDCPAYERTMRGMPAVVMLRLRVDALCGKANRGRLD